MAVSIDALRELWGRVQWQVVSFTVLAFTTVDVADEDPDRLVLIASNPGRTNDWILGIGTTATSGHGIRVKATGEPVYLDQAHYGPTVGQRMTAHNPNAANAQVTI